MEFLSISNLKSAAAVGQVEASVHVQVEAITQKETRDQKPYFEVALVDATSKMTLRAWSDSSAFQACSGMRRGEFLEVRGYFVKNGGFGLDAKNWECRPLTSEEREALLAGPGELREKQRVDFEFIMGTIATIRDPRLKSLCELFLTDFGVRFRRTAAARNYHHARRGGLVEHTSQMMRTGCLIADLYPQLNRDLLLSGILLHDSGKLWENSLPENGFTMLVTPESSQNSPNPILWWTPAIDITQAVINAYNASSGVAAPPPSAPRRPATTTPRPSAPATPKK